MLKEFNYSNIQSWNPCYDSSKYISKDWKGNVVDILKMDNIPFADRLWCVLRTELISEKVMRLFAVWSYRDTLNWVKNPDPRSIECVNVSERFANGEATQTELSAAESSARSAAWSAAESSAESAAESAARSAARSAAWSAAESSARSAAWSAAESSAESAAWSAAWSAWSAAWSAAESSAESSARSAAWSAAESSARSAAWSAAEFRQRDKLIEMILATNKD